DLYSYHESFRAPDARILVVDDTRINIMVVVNLLKKTQIMIDTAQNGNEGILLASENKYDVILLDQRMPGMDGTETLQHIRELENKKNADTPVICLTADAIRGARERYISEGFNDYLTKPVEGNDLERMLIKYLPKEKVITDVGSDSDSNDGSDPVKPKKDDSTVSGIDALKKEGFDIESAMKFCQDSEDLYLDVLTEFANEYDTRGGKLESYFSDKNWSEYGTLIHAVKSSSKIIGAMELSELALKLEEASKKGDAAFVELEHGNAMQKYRDVCDKIRRALGIGDAPATDDDDEILEFEASGS
ncbi:MAG: response regulator, partial [Lachnospiraceae bacterium]|nr:response regulator [Lachnospiraceae bacterium]